MAKIGLNIATALLAIAPLCADATAAMPRGAGREASATDFSSQTRPRRPRYVVRPYAVPYWRYYRECVDWYAVEARANGPTVVPHMSCRWAVR